MLRSPGPSSAFDFIRAAIASPPEMAEALRAHEADPQLGAFLARREVDGLLSAVGLDNSPWSGLYSSIWELQLAALRELLDALADAGVRTVIFKGAELVSRYFPRHPLGFFVDVDVLVDRADTQVVKRVLYQLGYSQSYFDQASFRLMPRDVRDVGDLEARHFELAPFCKALPYSCESEWSDALTARAEHPAYARKGESVVILEIDVHHNVALDTDPAPLMARAVPSCCTRALTLSAADHLWVNCSRFYNEVGLFGKRTLRPLVYTAPLLRETIDWDVVMSCARELQLTASLYYTLRTLAELTGVAVPNEVLANVHPRTAGAERDFGWQLGPLFDFIEPFPLQ